MAGVAGSGAGEALQIVQDAQIDPSGRKVAYVVAALALERGEPMPRSRIWVCCDAGAPYPATAGGTSDIQPRWSPNGETLAFCSDRLKRGQGQLYLLRSGWREPEPLHRFPAGIGDFAWSPDGAAIAVVAGDAAPERDADADYQLVEDDSRYDRLWLVDVATGQARQVTTEPLNVWEIAWSPDGRSIAAIVSPLPHRWSWYHSRLVRIDVETGSIETLHTPESQLARPAWSPDGRAVAVVASTWSDPGMTGGDVLLVPVDGGDARNLTPGDTRSHLSLHWQPDGQSLLTAAQERGEAAICEIGLRGGCETLWRDQRQFSSQAMSVDAEGRRVAAALSAFLEPSEVWHGQLNGGIEWRQVSGHNAALAGTLPADIEAISWRSSDGLEVSGVLVRPRGKTGRLPLVTMIHGGPTSAWGFAYPAAGPVAWIPGLLEHGAAVLMPNPRGSTGWGLEFAEANHGDMGGEDLTDILTGIDWLVEQGIADPEKLGVCGWSYGGYLTAWAITQTTRFRAAIAGACITNWFSFHGTSDIPSFDQIFHGADPYALDGPYAGRSPIFFADRVETPTLFLHGERDHCCPVGQPLEMFRALRDRGVETQCVIYPREGHPVRENAHRLDMLERGLGWFTRHLDI